MTTDRQRNRIIICCDVCGETEEDTAPADEPHAFDEFWRAKKEEGWSAEKKIKGGYEHRCPDCSRTHR